MLCSWPPLDKTILVSLTSTRLGAGRRSGLPPTKGASSIPGARSENPSVGLRVRKPIMVPKTKRAKRKRAMQNFLRRRDIAAVCGAEIRRLLVIWIIIIITQMYIKCVQFKLRIVQLFTHDLDKNNTILNNYFVPYAYGMLIESLNPRARLLWKCASWILWKKRKCFWCLSHFNPSFFFFLSRIRIKPGFSLLTPSVFISIPRLIIPLILHHPLLTLLQISPPSRVLAFNLF